MQRFALQFVLVLACASPVLAQVPSGAVAGTVTDQNGGVLANATITVTNKATGLSRVVQSGRDGTFSVPSLPAGRYDVLVVTQGFQPAGSVADVVTGSTATVTMPGAIIGRLTWKNVRASLAPSSRAASMISSGTASAANVHIR